MPITSSAKKALRNAARRRIFNMRRKTAMKDAVKRVRSFATAKSHITASAATNDAQSLLQAAYKAIDKAAKRGVIKPNAASRKKSRLALLLNRAGNAAK